MNDDGPRHPKAMTMAAFVEGTLARDEIAGVAAHLRTCGDCRTVVAETARFEREEERRPVTARRSWWLAAAAVLAVIAAGVPLAVRWNGLRASPMARLIAAVPAHRSMEARLSGFPYGRLQAPARGDAPPDPADLKLGGAAGDVLQTTRDRRDAEALHASGVAYFVIGRWNESIAALEQAARQSNDARAWSDLAAARHARAAGDEHPMELPQALADADRALRADARLPEARFNRALILEAMGLRDEARKAWETYLSLDPASEWSREARAHLKRLTGAPARFDPKRFDEMPPDALVRDYPQEARTWAEGPFLADWADAEAAHDAARASAALTRTRALAGALARVNGEHLLHDAVAAIERARGDAREALVRAHRLHRDARIDYRGRLFAPAEKGFRAASALFAQGGSPMADVASYYAACAASDQNRVDQARGELLALLERVDRSRHRALEAQIHWQLTVCANAAGDWGTATREADAGATIFRSLGETSNAAFVDAIGAMASELIGESDTAWRKRVQALSLFSMSGDGVRLATILHNSALTLAAVNRRDAALSLLVLFTGDDRRDDPAQLSWSEADVARLAARNGDVERAQRSLENARALSGRVADATLRDSVRAQIDLAEATLRTAGDSRAAIALLDRSIAFFRENQRPLDVADAYLQRARARRASGESGAALEDYAAALREIERQRTSIGGAESRLRFLDTAGAIIEETIDLRLARGDPAGAFEVADRVRTLLDSPAVESSWSAIELPPQTALVEYAVLPRSVVAFCVARGRITAQRIEIDRHELQARVDGFADRIRRRDDLAAIHRDGAALHRLLIEPLRSRLGGLDELVIVPDGRLQAVPFAALLDERSGRYLAEEFVIRFAPSASFRRDAGGELAPALVIADPRTSLGPRLPGSRDEAARIATLYGATLLAGEAATRAAFTGAAAGSGLIHFAGHANSDAGSSYGALLLAPAGSDSGVVGATDVARLRLDRHPLVILAACGTFRGSALHVAGMSSLSRAFLFAGARGVVGTLWEIDDEVSATLFLRIHERLRAGLPPARALRDAQLDLLRSADPLLSHPAAWSPVEYLSGIGQKV